jgi:hypothetical protein
MRIKVGMKLSTKLTHENVLRNIELVNLLKIHYKSPFNQKLLRVKSTLQCPENVVTNFFSSKLCNFQLPPSKY